MKWIEKLVEKKVNERLESKFKEVLSSALGTMTIQISDVYEEIKSFEDIMRETHHRLDKTKEFLAQVEKAVSVKENIETIMNSTEWLRRAYWDVAERTRNTTHEYNPATDDWQEKAIEIKVSKEKPFAGRLKNGFGMSVKAIKYIEGDGYGKYDIIVNNIKRGYFVKRKNGNEDGAILNNQLNYIKQNDILEIKQKSGNGALKCALIAIVAGNSIMLYCDDYLHFET